MVEPETLPPLSVKGPMPVVGLRCWLLPVCAMSETSPRGRAAAGPVQH